MKKNVGLLLLGIWLVLHGLFHFVDVHVSGQGTVMALLALAAGVLIIMERRTVAR